MNTTLYVDLKWISKEPRHDHHQIINDPAKRGWRLFQIIAPGIVVSVKQHIVNSFLRGR